VRPPGEKAAGRKKGVIVAKLKLWTHNHIGGLGMKRTASVGGTVGPGTSQPFRRTADCLHLGSKEAERSCYTKNGDGEKK